MKYKTFIIISSFSYLLFIAVNVLSWNRHEPISENAVSGKEVWQKYNCISCHTIFGNGGYVGGDLTHITQQRSKDELFDFFKDPPVIPPNKEIRHTSLNSMETESIIGYFEYLSSIPTLGWPPDPQKLETGNSL